MIQPNGSWTHAARIPKSWLLSKIQTFQIYISKFQFFFISQVLRSAFFFSYLRTNIQVSKIIVINLAYPIRRFLGGLFRKTFLIMASIENIDVEVKIHLYVIKIQFHSSTREKWVLTDRRTKSFYKSLTNPTFLSRINTSS